MAQDNPASTNVPPPDTGRVREFRRLPGNHYRRNCPVVCPSPPYHERARCHKKESWRPYGGAHRKSGSTGERISVEWSSPLDISKLAQSGSAPVLVLDRGHRDDRGYSDLFLSHSSHKRWRRLTDSLKAYLFLSPEVAASGERYKTTIHVDATISLLNKRGLVKRKRAISLEAVLEYEKQTRNVLKSLPTDYNRMQYRITQPGSCPGIISRDVFDSLKKTGDDTKDGKQSRKRIRSKAAKRQRWSPLHEDLLDSDSEDEDEDENLNNDMAQHLTARGFVGGLEMEEGPTYSELRRRTDKFFRSQKRKSMSFISDTWLVEVEARKVRRPTSDKLSVIPAFSCTASQPGREGGQSDRFEASSGPGRRPITLADFWPRDTGHRLAISTDSGGIFTEDERVISGESRDKVDDDVRDSIFTTTAPVQTTRQKDSEASQDGSVVSSNKTWDDTASSSHVNSVDSHSEKLELQVKDGEDEQNDGAQQKKDSEEKDKSYSPVNKMLDENEGNLYVRVKLDRSRIRPDQLQAEFRRDYCEAACKPRRFVLNVSRLAYHRVALLNRLRCSKMSRTDLTTYLVFAFRRELSSRLDEYRVWLSATWSDNLTANDVFRSALRSGEVSLGDLIQSAVAAIDSLDILALRHDHEGRNWTDARLFPTRPDCTFFLLTSMTKWNNGSFQLPRATEWFDNSLVLNKLRDIFESETNLQNLEHDMSGVLNDSLDNPLEERREADFDFSQAENPGPKSPTVCSICLTDLSKTNMGLDPSPLALQLCSHWFCEQCWRYRILQAAKANDDQNDHVISSSTSTNSGKSNVAKSYGYLKCLKKSCKTPIEHITLLTILDLQHIRSYNKRKAEQYFLSVPMAKPCPNPHCDRILYSKPTSVSKNDALSFVACKCSTQVCFSCLQPAHWPASCGTAQRYRLFLTTQSCDVLHRPLADSELPDVILRGKHCPNCGLFLQTTKTSRSERCGECGCQVCVPCGREIQHGRVEEHASCQEIFVLNDVNFKKNLLVKEQTSADVNVSRWYAKAMEHRLLRHPQVIDSLYAMSDVVAGKILEAAGEGFYIGDGKKAAAGWREKLIQWNKENQDRLADTQSARGSRRMPSSAPRPLSRTFSSLSNTSAGSLSSDSDELPLDDVIRRAARNLTHVTLELHHALEFTCVLLEEQPRCHVPLLTHMERAEDVCTALAILLQESHVHNASRILPAFVRLEVKVKQVWGNMVNLLEADRDS